MITIEKLAKSIDQYYKKAMRSYNLIRYAAGWEDVPDVSDDYEEETGTEAPVDYEEESNEDEPPYFDELLDVSRLTDSELGFQLNILAELYKRALQIGGGYATIAKAINGVKDLYGNELPDEVESVLNSITIQLAKEAGGATALAGRDNPRFVQQIIDLKNDIELRGKPEPKSSDIEGVFNREQQFPGALPEGEQIKGKKDDTVDKKPEEEEAEEKPDDVYDAPGGGKDGPKVNPGKSTFTRKGPKDMVRQYSDAAQVAEIEMAGEQDPKRVNNLKTLSVLLRQASALEAKALKLYDEEINPRGDAALPEHKAELAQYHKELAELLKKKIYPLNRKIFEARMMKIISDLKAELATERDPKEQERLKQKISLNELSLSKDVGKTPERTARLELIRMMDGGNFPGVDIYNKQMGKINEAAAQKKPFEEYISGKRQEHNVQRAEDILSGNIKGLVLLVSEQYASFISDNKKLKEDAYHNEPAIAHHANTYKLILKASLKNPSPEMDQKLEATKQVLATAIEEYKKKLAKVEEIKEQLQALANYSKGRYSKPRTPWFWLEEIPEDKKMILHELIMKLNTINMEFERPMPWAININILADKLKEKIATRARIAYPGFSESLPADKQKRLSDFEPEGELIQEESPERKQMSISLPPTKGHMSNKKRKTILERITKEAQTTSESELDAKAEEATKKLFLELWDSSPTRLAGEK
jgi:hypothetical protein